MKSAVWIIIASFLLLGGPASPVYPSSAELLIAEGRTLLELGNEKEARDLFKQALIEEPGNQEALMYLQQIAAPTGESGVAAGAGEDSGVEASGKSEPPAGSGGEEKGAEDLVGAPVPATGAERVSVSESGGADIPVSPRLRVRYFYRRGLAAYEGKKYPDAIRDFEEVLKVNPDYRRADYYRRDAWNKIASQELIKERAEDEMVGKATEREAYDAYARGKEYMRYGRYGEAVREFQEVLGVNPSHRGARELLGEARLKLEKQAFEEEVAVAEKILKEEEALRSMTEEEESVVVESAYLEGRQLYEQEEYEQAREKFDQVCRMKDRFRRTDFYLQRIDKELWEKKELKRREDREESSKKYTLGPDDKVKVVVRNHPEFSFGAAVEEGGELIIPLTNEIIMAEGLTRDELAEEIRKKLTAYIDNPFVNVFITGYNSKKFYVLMSKGGGGEYAMDKANMTLWDCMFRAGIPALGSTAMRRIQVITPHKTHPTHRWINVFAMLYEGKMEDNIRIEPGTIIYYPMLVIDKFAEILTAIARPINILSTAASDYETWDTFRREYLR